MLRITSLKIGYKKKQVEEGYSWECPLLDNAWAHCLSKAKKVKLNLERSWGRAFERRPFLFGQCSIYVQETEVARTSWACHTKGSTQNVRGDIIGMCGWADNQSSKMQVVRRVRWGQTTGVSYMYANICGVWVPCLSKVALLRRFPRMTNVLRRTWDLINCGSASCVLCVLKLGLAGGSVKVAQNCPPPDRISCSRHRSKSSIPLLKGKESKGKTWNQWLWSE